MFGCSSLYLTREPQKIHGNEGTSGGKYQGDELQADEVNSIVSNYLLGGGELELPKGLQEEDNLLDAVSYNGLVQTGVGLDDGGKGFESVTRARRFTSRLELLDSILQEVSSKLKEKIASARQRVERVGFASGLASLPTEVIAKIFSYAIYGTLRSSTPRALASVRLSHVCRSFRNTVLTNPHFWNDISSTPRKPKLGLVEACLQRSEGAPLDIELYLYASQVVVGVMPTPPNDPYLQDVFPKGVPVLETQLLCEKTAHLVMPHIGRWRSLTLHFVDVMGFSAPGDKFDPIQGVVFPILESVAEYHDGNHEDKLDRTMAYASSWSTPALRSLVLQNSLPHSLSGLGSISTFDVDLSYCRDVARMFAVVSEMEGLREFSLDISNLNFAKSENIREEDLGALEKDIPVEQNSVDTFTLRCASNDAADSESFEFRYLHAVLSKLYLPLAKKFIFNAQRNRASAGPAYGFATTTHRNSGKSLLLHRLLSGLANRVPKITDCDISISQETNQLINATFPTHLPPELKNLTFVSNATLLFPEKDFQESDSAMSKLEALTLGLISSANNMTASKRWANWLLGCAEQRGGWDAFENLLLLKHLEHKDVFEYAVTIKRDKVLLWCTSSASLSDCGVAESNLKGKQVSFSFGNSGQREGVGHKKPLFGEFGTFGTMNLVT